MKRLPSLQSGGRPQQQMAQLAEVTSTDWVPSCEIFGTASNIHLVRKTSAWNMFVKHCDFYEIILRNAWIKSVAMLWGILWEVALYDFHLIFKSVSVESDFDKNFNKSCDFYFFFRGCRKPWIALIWNDLFCICRVLLLQNIRRWKIIPHLYTASFWLSV